MSGKGDTPRPCDGDRFRKEHDRIFGPKPKPATDEQRSATTTGH